MSSSGSARPWPSTTSTSRSRTASSSASWALRLRQDDDPADDRRLRAADLGLIELQGQDVTWLPPYKRHVNTVFQNYALFPHLTIFENVAFGLRRKGVKDNEVKGRVTEMLQLVELPGFERRKPTQISGGQAQRVALARALINKPGRPAARRAARRPRPEAAQADAGRAQAHPAGGRHHVHLRDPRPGRGDDDVRSHRGHEQRPLRAAGRSRRACTSARTTRFVAGFLGISNLLPGTSRAATASTRPSASPTTRPSACPRPDVGSADALAVGVRPEKIRLRETAEPVPDGHNQLTGVVRDASYLGV